MAAGGGACVVISGEIWGACACALLWRVDGKRGGVGGSPVPAVRIHRVGDGLRT
jgi:hypothetical protein